MKKRQEAGKGEVREGRRTRRIPKMKGDGERGQADERGGP